MIAGVELRKERRLSEVLTDSFNILFAHWKHFAVIAVPLIVANVAFALVFLALAPDVAGPDGFSSTEEITDEDVTQLLLLGVAGVISLPIFIALYQLVGGAAVLYLDEAAKERDVTPGGSLDAAQGQLWALIGAAMRAFAIVLLLSITIVGIPWAINRAVRWVFLIQVIMLEGKSGEGVLAASSQLVKGRWWNTLGRLIVTGLVIGIPVQLLAQALASALPDVIGSILSASTVFITASYGIISISLMYFDLTARRRNDDSFSPYREPPAEPDSPGQGA